MKIPPFKQDYFDQNREKYDAQTSAVDLEMPPKCKHEWKRVNSMNVICARCQMTHIDNGKVFPFDKYPIMSQG